MLKKEKNMKLLKTFIILMFCAKLILAQNIVWVDSTTANPNESVQVAVKINNAVKFSAFQLDIEIPPVLQYIENSSLLNNLRKQDHILSVSLLNKTTLRMIAFSSSGKNFLGSSGNILTFNCKVKQNPGTYILNLSNMVISDSLNQNLLFNSNNGQFVLTAPLIQFDQSAIQFSSIPLGTSETRYLNITNIGNLPLSINGLSSNLSEIKFTDSNSFVLQPNQSNSKQIDFIPSVKGNKNGTLVIKSNSISEQNKQINITGHAYAVNEIHVGQISGRSGYPANLKIFINNMEEFSAFEFTLFSPSEMNFINGSEILNRNVDHQIFINKISNSSLKVVCYSPTNKSFIGSDGEILELGFLLNGNGGYYNIGIGNAIISDLNSTNIISAVYSGGLQIASPSLNIYDTNISFGNVSIMDTGIVNVNINNYGNDTLKINSIIFDNNLFYSNGQLPILILPYEYNNIKLKFHSSIKGNFSSKAKIFNNDYLRNPTTINLSAKAFAPNIIIGSDVSGFVNDTISYPIKIKNTEAFTAFQFDLLMPTGIEIIPNSILLTNRATSSHAISYSTLPNGVIRIIAYSINQSLFQGDSGAVCTIKLKLNNDPNEYPVTISNGIIGNINNQNIISSIQNGKIIINSKTKIYGQVIYNNAIQSKLANIQVVLKKNDEVFKTMLSNDQGEYLFENIENGNYELSVICNGELSSITSTDALLIRRYVVGNLTLNPVQILAADVNNSQIINSTDALLIRRFIVGQIQSFALGTWVFEKVNLQVSGYDILRNITGSIVGDINASFQP